MDQTETKLRAIMADVLGLGAARATALTEASALFGALPEFDSMAVAIVLTELEDRLDIIIDDDEVDGELFATFGSLLAFCRAKQAA
jgi:acyl carrier protein